jgi:ATP synthase F1 delta subunit
MTYLQSAVAKQYAKAYLQEYGSSLQLEDIEHIKLAVQFFRRHHTFMSLVSLIVAHDQSDHVIMQELWSHFQLPQTLKKLIPVLINHKRLVIFAQVLQGICCQYLSSNNILELTVLTAQPLADSELKQFEQFFIKLSGKKIISKMVLDETLIAGVRLQSDLFLWQYSIAARVKNLQQKMLIEG